MNHTQKGNRILQGGQPPVHLAKVLSTEYFEVPEYFTGVLSTEYFGCLNTEVPRIPITHSLPSPPLL